MESYFDPFLCSSAAFCPEAGDVKQRKCSVFIATPFWWVCVTSLLTYMLMLQIIVLLWDLITVVAPDLLLVVTFCLSYAYADFPFCCLVQTCQPWRKFWSTNLWISAHVPTVHLCAAKKANLFVFFESNTLFKKGQIHSKHDWNMFNMSIINE